MLLAIHAAALLMFHQSTFRQAFSSAALYGAQQASRRGQRQNIANVNNIKFCESFISHFNAIV
jgi:hypothetical protein